MKHTKNILKSLLITVMALSLLAVSCKKDEGGSKPTDPTPSTTKITEITILNAIKSLGKNVDVATAIVDFQSVTKIEATINLTATKGNAATSVGAFKTGMKTKLEKIKVEGATVTVGAAGGDGADGNQNPITFVVTISAENGYELDSTIAGYQANKTVKLTLKFTPSDNWAQ